MILSILIPSIPERKDNLGNLLYELGCQRKHLNKLHPTLGDIQVLVDDSKKVLDGGISVGLKRNKLVKRAKGKYLCFLDDDDMVSPNYVEALVRMCQNDADVCTFKSLFTCDTYWAIINMNLGIPNDQVNPKGETQRNAWHICPVKSTYAKMYEFSDKNNAEDSEWMEKVLTHCKTQTHTDEVLHNYRHSAKTSAVDEIERHEV